MDPHSIVAAWKKLFEKQGYELILKETTIDKLIEEALTKPTGARGMHFTLRKLLSPLLTQLIVQNEATHEDLSTTQNKYIEV